MESWRGNGNAMYLLKNEYVSNVREVTARCFSKRPTAVLLVCCYCQGRRPFDCFNRHFSGGQCLLIVRGLTDARRRTSSQSASILCTKRLHPFGKSNRGMTSCRLESLSSVGTLLARSRAIRMETSQVRSASGLMLNSVSNLSPRDVL